MKNRFLDTEIYFMFSLHEVQRSGQKEIAELHKSRMKVFSRISKVKSERRKKGAFSDTFLMSAKSVV